MMKTLHFLCLLCLSPMNCLHLGTNTETDPMHHELSEEPDVSDDSLVFAKELDQKLDKKPPKLPATLNASSYEAYLAKVVKSLREPAKEYRDLFPEKDDKNFFYRHRGLTMASKSYPGLKKQIEYIVDNDIVGDIYETGTWRGGTSIYMLAVLRAYEKLKGKHSQRSYYGFDSFEGFPVQTKDEKLDEYLSKKLYAAPLEKVKASFARYGVLDDRVNFVKGYFEESVPKFSAPNPIALLRLDGDLYSSTKVVLDNLYPHVSKGGWTVIDDYYWKPKEAKNTKKLCHEAVDEYREAHNITSKIQKLGRPSWIK